MTIGKYKASELNKSRASWAAQALCVFSVKNYGEKTFAELVRDDQLTCIGDFLTDLKHFCIQNKISFEDCCDQAEMHMQSERSGRE